MRLVWAILLSVGLAACGGSSGGEAHSLQVHGPAAPTGVTATAGDEYVMVDGTVDPTATAVNLYWKIGTGVTKANGTKLVVTTAPQMHTGLTNGTNYCYVVTAIVGGVESTDSAEHCATPTPVTAAADPLFADQWHLANTGQTGGNGVAGKAGKDINVTTSMGHHQGHRCTHRHRGRRTGSRS